MPFLEENRSIDEHPSPGLRPARPPPSFDEGEGWVRGVAATQVRALWPECHCHPV